MNAEIAILKKEINDLKIQAAIKQNHLNKIQMKIAEKMINNQGCGSFEMFHRGWWLPIIRVLGEGYREIKEFDHNSIYHLEQNHTFWPGLKVETERFKDYEPFIVQRIAELDSIRRASDKEPILKLM